MSEQVNCELCGEPMPEGEDMFFYHGYSGPCPKPPLPKVEPEPKPTFTEADLRRAREEATVAAAGAQRLDTLNRLRERYSWNGYHERSCDLCLDKNSTCTCMLGKLDSLFPIVTSDEGKKWLREHDAGVRAEAYRRCALELSGRRLQGLTIGAGPSEDQFEKWAAEATGTPAGTP